MMRKNLFHTPQKRSQGYALLLAILVANIILTMSMGIFSIALKEVTLTTYIKESQNAFGAADHMLECTLYWEMSAPQNGAQYTIFASSSSFVSPVGFDSASCDGILLNNIVAPPAGVGWSVTNLTPTTGMTTFYLRFANGTCADATVSKDAATGMVIVSNGYNDCNPNNPRRTQRTIEVTSNF